MLFIESDDKLKDILDNITTSKIIGVDTEFVRVNTYFPKLSLIQISTEKEIYIIDCLLVNVKLLEDIFISKDIVKIFHASLQDIQIFISIFNRAPNNIFDTQIAAKFCGLGNQISYKKLCEMFLNVEIKKDLQFSDWDLRPIRQDLMEYAALDVKYLIQLYKKLLEKIKILNVDQFFIMMKNLSDEEKYKIDIFSIWEKIKFDKNSEVMNERVKMISSLREEFAMSANVPRKHMMTDESILKISMKLPGSIEDFDKLKLRTKLTKEMKEEIIDLCTGFKNSEEIK